MSDLPLRYEINAEVDKRKLQKLVDNKKLTVEQLAEAPIFSESVCCGADFIGNSDGTNVRCSECGGQGI